MAKRPISLTIDETNLLWLKGRARVMAGGSVSAAVDQLVAEARAGRLGGAEPSRSVVGTIDLAHDPLLTGADAAIRAVFAGSLARSIVAPDTRGEDTPATGSRKKRGRG
ncbi:MAG: hypothetical protein Q8O42_13120 [Acidobacteriota bacterium]|nr:hypothetical protein [Acidobacteriota bacterium]